MRVQKAKHRSTMGGRSCVVGGRWSLVKRVPCYVFVISHPQPSPGIRNVLFKDPLLCGGAKFLGIIQYARFRINAHHRFGTREPIADPRAVVEEELEPIGPDDLG